MFELQPSARVSMKTGTLYAITGNLGWIFYGQVTPEKDIGFFRRRGHDLADPLDVLSTPVMSVVTVAYPSITRALRSGIWKNMGIFPVAEALTKPISRVQWSVGTLRVTVWTAGSHYDTRVDDAAIQGMELMAVWDAEWHVPGRLTADFGAEEAEWHVGGPIRRERQIKEELARRAPDRPEHELPDDWVPTSVR